MIRTLQRKFVFTAMTAITVLLLLLLGALNLINIRSVRSQIDERLTMISENEGNPDNIPRIPDGQPPVKPFGPKNDFDTFLSSNFFLVRFDAEGNIIQTDVSRVSSVSEEEAAEMAYRVCQKPTSSGKIEKYQYMIRDGIRIPGKVAVFLDISSELYSCLRVLGLSCAVGLICWLLMLLFVILLSRRAIRPIAANMERQKQFVTDAGHEIKTPLAIIRSNTEAMELYNGETRWSKNIKEQTVRLDELMKGLLTLSRLEESGADNSFTEFSLSELLEEQTACFLEPLSLRNITLQTQIQPRISLRANREHMIRLISVLMDNGAKYTTTGGTFSVSLQKSDRRIIMEFRNPCEQLPDAEPDRLFDRFYRADEARTREAGGYGIGLSVARSITEACRGKISASYEPEHIIVFTVIF